MRMDLCRTVRLAGWLTGWLVGDIWTECEYLMANDGVAMTVYGMAHTDGKMIEKIQHRRRSRRTPLLYYTQTAHTTTKVEYVPHTASESHIRCF